MNLKGTIVVSLAVALAALLTYKRKQDQVWQRCSRRRTGLVIEGKDLHEQLWPSSMGHPGNHGSSKHAGPKNFTEAFSWSWSDPKGRFRTPGLGGTVIDHHRNIYLAGNSAILKFSPDGEHLWNYFPAVHCGVPGPGFLMKAPCLWGNAVFGVTEQGSAFAVDMETGVEIWSTQYADMSQVQQKSQFLVNSGIHQVSEGVVVVGEFRTVHGLNATDGNILWVFKPDGALWSFKADFPGDGTFVFQTYEGKAYRCRVHDGSVVWSAGGQRGTWTNGNIALGPNRIVYTVNTKWMKEERQPTRFSLDYLFQGERGELTAFALEDGKRLWKYALKKPPNNAPAIGRLSPGAGYSVIQPIGQQDVRGEPYFVYALDAETGTLQWVFDGPVQQGARQACSDLSPSEQNALQATCVPNPWSAPTIDSTGTVYIANQEGPIYALKDVNGDGSVNGTAEVHSYSTMRGFCGSEAPSIVPGLMAIAACDTMYVFRYPE
mmetsp:Transcript_89211/g.260827  ORF Transcript_89211/g.260827 Transcript_89211/m.260827 type:complete len:489 (-) Transcript_89211:57-1523(-)